MNDLLVTIFVDIIINENEKNYLAQKNGRTPGLNKSEGEHKIGEAAEGPGYQNQKRGNRITAQISKSRIGHYISGIAATTREDLGASVDIGFPDKDFVVPLDELPTITELWSEKEDRLVVFLRVDAKDRVWRSLADGKIFESLSRYGIGEVKNKDVIGIAYRLKSTGMYVLAEDFYLGFIHPSE